MSLENGGRADKYGNRYENRFLARLLLRLAKEEITSVEVEPLGDDGDGVEFIATSTDGTRAYYQCKASNTTHNYWSMYDLKKYAVFDRSKALVEKEENNYYFFISPLQYNGLDELCKRARTNSSVQDFVSYQLSNSSLNNTFNDCANYYGLNKSNPLEFKQLVNILAHCYFEQVPSGKEAEQDLNEHVGMVFSGKAALVRVLLEQYANDTGKFGIKITTKDVIDYLGILDIYVRNYYRDDRVLASISVINEIYWGVYQPINNCLIHRAATDSVIQQIQEGLL
jgi:hypothetical protein